MPRSVDEIDTHVLAKELCKLNLKRTQGEWKLFEDRYLIADNRTTPTVAQTGTIKAKENAAFLAYLAGNATTIIEKLERLARLEKMILELPQSGETASSAVVTSTRSDTPQVAGLA
jgi:hypothetical protein